VPAERASLQGRQGPEDRGDLGWHGDPVRRDDPEHVGERLRVRGESRAQVPRHEPAQRALQGLHVDVRRVIGDLEQSVPQRGGISPVDRQQEGLQRALQLGVEVTDGAEIQ